MWNIFFISIIILKTDNKAKKEKSRVCRPGGNKKEKRGHRREIYVALARWAARLPTWAWKPDLMLATEQVAPQFSHFKKNRRSSLTMLVSGDRQVWQVTYSSTINNIGLNQMSQR